jgi:hypothetical protein
MLPSPPPVPPSSDHARTADPVLDDETVARALMQGLLDRDPASPRVSLATVRALRRAERGHVDRVVAVVHACTESVRRGESREALSRHLDDLAPFERAAALRLLDANHPPAVEGERHGTPGAAPQPAAVRLPPRVSPRTPPVRGR